MCVTPDGELLITADSAGTVCVWNTFTQSRVSVTSASQAMCSFAHAHSGSVTALCALVDAFVSGGTDQAVKLYADLSDSHYILLIVHACSIIDSWSISSRQCLHSFDVEASSISAITAFRSHG
jgi:WD40 repeat protein